jgi:hypothetical protein
MTGSTKFGTIITNTHQFTGSVGVTGSITVIDGVTNNLTASWAARAVTASIADNAVTASRALNANTASFATSAANATTASFATSAATATSATTATSVVATVTGTNTTELVRGNMADNDQFRILVGGTATNAGYAEIATADDGTEPIHVRQYTGVFSSLTRTATLLDGSGNTSFPGTVSATFSGNLTGTASFATFATNAMSASIAANAVTASRALNANTASFATSAASATSASYATFAATATSATSATSAASATSASYATFAATASSANGFTVRETLIANGNVGIGTTSVGTYVLALDFNASTAAVISIKNSSTSGYSGAHIMNNSGTLMGHWGYANASAAAPLTDKVYFGSTAAKDVVFTSTDTTRMTITSGGDVGIGTTSPTYKLHVIGDIGINQPSAIIFANAQTIRDNGSGGLGIASGASINNTVAGGGVYTINGGNVGIGTTSPAYKLEVFGDKSRFYNVVIGGTVGGAYAAYSDSVVGISNLHLTATGSGGVYINTAIALTTYINPVGGAVLVGTTSENSFSSANSIQINGSSGALVETRYNTTSGLRVGSSSDHGYLWDPRAVYMRFGTSDTERMRIASNGSVGIGTTSPQSILHVGGTVSYGSIRVTPTTANGESAIAFFKDTAGTDQNDSWVIGHAGWGNTGDFVIGNENNGAGGNVRLLIEQSGNVGIGTTSPISKLDVYSSVATATAPTMFLSQNAGYGQIVALDSYHGLTLRGYPTVNSDYTTTAADVMSFFEYGGDFRFYKKNVSVLTLQGCLNDGTWTVTGDVVAYGSPSDITLKTNIKPLEGALEKVMKLQGVSFTWKEDTEMSKMINLKDDIGFIAQEVQEVIPDLVRKNDNGLLSLRDKGITALLVEAIKEQQKQIDELKYLLKNK